MDEKKLLKYAVDYLSKYDSSKNNLVSVLKRKILRLNVTNFEKKKLIDIIESIILKLEKNKFIDDDRYSSTKILSLSNSGRSKNFIFNYLIKKGVSKSQIQNNLNLMKQDNENWELESARIFAKKKKLLEKIENCCQKNDLMIFCSARLSLRLGQNDRAIQILENRNKNNFYFHYLDYLYAMSAMYKQDYLKAEKYFLQFTDNFRGSNYIKSAYHKLYHISVLTNSIEKQEKYKYLVLNKGNSLIDEDRRAEDEIKNNNPINIDLLTATLLYDGGYYKKALQKLISIDTLNIDNYNHKIEFAYRNARVYQKLEDKKTISYFMKLIGMNNSSNLYYFPMSNLQIGLEYEKQGNFKQALNYFNKVFDYKDYDYENGIKKSAQAAINRLSN